MNLGTQYYRPPFPNKRFWADDMARMKDGGLNTVQLWVIWGWVESQPDQFRYEDYDELIELADKTGLGVVLSTIAAVQPYWIHSVVPGSEMVTNEGRPVVSSNRVECHFGITPGGCFDHPGVWKRMRAFLETTAKRYHKLPVLRGWDAWNEIRWNVQAGGPVCYCEHTLAAFRAWLDKRYGGLEGLNDAWTRRYGSWEEVKPGKSHDLPYTEMMAFTHFLTERTNQHARDRYDVMKGVDPQHPVTVHGAFPAPTWPGTPDNQVLNRGNDWDFADHLDGVGCSSFPKWQKLDDADFGMRIEFVKSAARGKHVWLSELQGGRSSTAFEIFPAVDALSQQRWIWNGIACGADTILFWCWRDEVFGRESAGFGLIGADGLAEERLEAMKVTGTAIERHSELLSAYEPVTPEVGVLFSPQSYYLNWAAEGHANRCVLSLMGYARALVRRSIPYVIVEECHLDQLEGLKVLFMPKTIALSEDTERRLQAWVEAGGVLVTESECGAFGPEGLYHYSPDRWLAKMTGVTEIGRRPCEGEFLPVSVAGEELELPITQWVTPMDGSGKALASSAQGPLVLRRDVGQGSVVLCGAYFGEAYRAKYAPGFERFLEAMAREAGWTPQYEVLAPAAEDDRFLYVKMGASQGRTVAFVFFPEGWPEGRVRFAPGAFPNGQAADIITGAEVAFEEGPGGQEATLTAPDWRFYVLAGA